jgi:hypothetical protein
MANKLGAAFLRCALGPLNYAGGCILAGRVPDGLRELSADNLHGGLKRGLAEAAGQVGVRVPDVERLLPMADVNAAAARLDAAQQAAVAAWATYAGHIGGLLRGVADLTVDGRAPDVSNFLERLSRKVTRDRPLADPLHALSVEVALWLDLVEHCGDLLADGGVLAQAYQRRRIRNLMLLGAGGVALAVALSVVLWVSVVRARIEGPLSAADPCAAFSIDPADLARASSDQQQRAQERRAACEDRRRRDAEAREAQRRREEKAREEERRKQEREARCDGLARRLTGGDLLPEDESLAPGKGELLARIAQRALDRADMAETDLPCSDAPAAPKIATAFAVAVIASPGAWANADEVSPRVAAVLVEHQAELPAAAKQQIQVHADDLVKRALFQKTPAATAKAVRACKLKDDMALRGSKYCAGIPALQAAGKL